LSVTSAGGPGEGSSTIARRNPSVIGDRALSEISFDRPWRTVYCVSMTTYTDPTTESEPEVNTAKLEKIRALLDKAESTAAEFPAEAEALTAKAVELMERYRIDEAMIADAAPLQDRGKIIETRINVGSGPYVNARVHLADQIARNHSVKLLQSVGYKGKMIYLNGYETDVALTEMLYTSLLVQATRAMSSIEVKATKPDFVHGTAFNRSFLLAFATRIGDRLRESINIATSDITASAPTGERSVALVLADRSKDVDADVLRRYGRLRQAKPMASASSYDGTRAGTLAADRADLSINRRVSASHTKALSA
jgi:hypothetical protein